MVHFPGGELYNITQWGELYIITQWCTFHTGELYSTTELTHELSDVWKVFPGVNNFILRWVFNFCLFLSWYYRAKCLILVGGVEDGMIFIARTVIL